jgi:hypothetical protein
VQGRRVPPEHLVVFIDLDAAEQALVEDFCTYECSEYPIAGPFNAEGGQGSRV